MGEIAFADHSSEYFVGIAHIPEKFRGPRVLHPTLSVTTDLNLGEGYTSVDSLSDPIYIPLKARPLETGRIPEHLYQDGNLLVRVHLGQGAISVIDPHTQEDHRITWDRDTPSFNERISEFITRISDS